jgi:hypothetical protein
MEKKEKIKFANEQIKQYLDDFYSINDLGAPDLEITVCQSHDVINHIFVKSKDRNTKCCFDLKTLKTNGNITLNDYNVLKEFVALELNMIKALINEINDPQI